MVGSSNWCGRTAWCSSDSEA